MTEDHHADGATDPARGVPATPRHRLHVAARTDPGLIRANNEDSFFAGSRVLVVADGMGGHAAGEVASRLVVDAIAPLDATAPSPDLSVDLVDATRRGNAAIAGVVAEHPALEGMGTTVTAILFDGRRAALAHVGDSRAYLYRSGVLHQLTHDDTFVQSLVDEGRITEAQAHDHPQRNLVLRALTGIEIDPSIAIREARRGDRYLICSDGLCGVVGAESIADALADPDPDVAADALVRLALEAGAPDNVTVIVADVVDIDGAATDPATTEVAPALADDPSSTNPIQQLTREMPRVPLPPIPEEPGAAAEIIGGASTVDEDEDVDDDDSDEDDDEDDGDGEGDQGDEGDEGTRDGGDVARGDRSPRGRRTAASPVAGGARGGATGATGRAARMRDRLRGKGSRAAEAKSPTPGRPGSRSDSVRPPARRRWYRRSVLVVAAAILLAVGITGSTIWVRHQYFISDQGNLVVVFRGVDGSLLGWHLSTFEETSCAGNTNCSPMRVSDLQPAAQNQVRAGIKATSLADARDVVQRLSGQLLPPCPTTQTGADGATGDAPTTSAPGPTAPAATTEVAPTAETDRPSARPVTAPATRPALAITTAAADSALAADGPARDASAQHEDIVIPGTASPVASRAAATVGTARDTAKLTAESTTTILPVPSAVTVTETVTATPLAPAPAVPGVTCRSTS